MAAAPPPPPPGLNYIAVISPVLHSVLIGHSFLVLFVPLVCGLLFFSTTNTRRQPVFLLNIFNICLAIAVGIMLDYRGVWLTLDPLSNFPYPFNLSISIMGIIQSLLIDVILLIRLVSVYPRDLVGTQRFVLIITLPVLLKIGRFINLVLLSKTLVALSSGPNAEATILQKWAHAPYIKIEWFGQLIDVSYASSLFLYKIWLHRKDRGQVDSDGGNNKVSFGYRLKVLFYIATTNFVVPALFSLIQIITLYRETDQEVTNDIVLVNTNISVILVVFASIWAGSWARSEEIADGLPFHGHAPHGAATQTMTGNRSMHFAVRSLAARSTTGTGGTVDLSSTRGVPSDANASVPMFISAEKKGGEKAEIEEDMVSSTPGIPRSSDLPNF